MAKSRSRKRSSPTPLGARQSPVVSSTAVGRYPTTRVLRSPLLRPLQALPNPLPNPIPAIIARVREYSPAPKVAVRRVPQAPAVLRPRPGRMIAVQRKQLRMLHEIPPPVSRRRLTPCQQRADRREAVFAAGVAGKKWRAGGPKMWHARHNLNSSFSCRR